MRLTAKLLPVAVLLLAACDGGSTGPSTPPTLTLSPDSLTLQVQQEETLTATYDDPRGPVTPIVAWQSTDTAVATVSSTGTVRGVAPGTAMIVAIARQAADTAYVTVLSPASAACGTNGLSLALGEVRTLTTAEAGLVCLEGGDGSEYTVVVTDTGSTAATLDVAAAGTRSPTGPPNPDRIPAFGALRARGLASRPDLAFESRLRLRGYRLMADRMAASRARASRRTLVPGRRLDVQVGDPMTLKVDTANDCSSPVVAHTGKVVAVGTHSIIVADTANPAGGFTTAQYQQVASTFDNQIWPSDTENFGEPVDIDANGKVILFYTRAVNELTPEGGPEGFVGGYFFPGDIYPPSECASSNQAEMFYLLAPDSAGVINNNKHTAEEVIQETEGTVAHEFEHLINSERRIYVNNASVPEDVWLDEGLAHIAEELLFYRVTSLGPRQNIDLAKLRSTDVILNAVNNFQIANLGRTISYLEDTPGNGPFEPGDDDLETRGAIWQFLRYAVDRKNGTDRDYWFALVNSTTHGKDNLRTALGIDPSAWLADFTTAQYTDDAVAGVDARYTFPSWNFRSVLPAINDNVYPLKTRPLPDGLRISLNLKDDGGTAYLRAAVGAGGIGSIEMTTGAGGTFPSRVTVTVIRTK